MTGLKLIPDTSVLRQFHLSLSLWRCKLYYTALNSARPKYATAYATGHSSETLQRRCKITYGLHLPNLLAWNHTVLLNFRLSLL